MTQKASVQKKNSQTVESNLPVVDRVTKILMNVSTVLALLLVVVPLIPLATRVNETSDTVMYNMIGVLNQDVGTNATRDAAVTMLMYFMTAVILMVVGYVTAMFRQKSSAVFHVLGGAAMAVFSIAWTNNMFGIGESAVVTGGSVRTYTQIEAAKISFEHSPFPVLMIILSFGLIGSGLTLFCFYKEQKQ